MKDREPTIRSRELGEGLRQAMQRAGHNGKTSAVQLGWSGARVSRLLSGKRGGSAVDVSAFLAVCGVTGRERERLLGLCEDQHRMGWLQQYGARLPKQVRTLIDHENKATKIRDFEALVIPGLLQTTDYARAVIVGSGAVPDGEIDSRVGARLGRQQLFSRAGRPGFTFFIHELVLRLPVGDVGVMSDQLHQLLRASVRPNLEVRVVPATAGAHAGMAGSFRFMEFEVIKPVVYVESETASLFLEEPEEIASYGGILDRLDGIALDVGQSRELIADLAVRLYAAREDHDDLA